MRLLLGLGRQPSPLPLFPAAKRTSPRLLSRLLPASRLLRLLLLLAALSLVPPAFFHLRLRRFHRVRPPRSSDPSIQQPRSGGFYPSNAFLGDPFVVAFCWVSRCARGGAGGSRARRWCARTAATPPTPSPTRWTPSGWLWTRASTAWRWTCRGPSMASSLRCTTGRDLQRMSGNSTAKVGHWSTDEIKALSTRFQLSKTVQNEEVPKAEDALVLISQSVRQVILDVKVGPPSFEKDLAEDALSVIRRTNCRNCLIWAKSDDIGRDVIKLSKDVVVGYIVMVDPSTGRRNELVRMEGAKVAGVYHPLIHEKLVKVMHKNGKIVYAWTVDDGDSMKRMLYEHVDAIVTSNPSLLQQLMQDTRAECMEDGFALP